MGYIGSGVQRFNTADGLTVTGSAEINSLTYPTADGSNGQVLKTNGSGTLSFGTVSTDLVNDTSPQLGGALDVQTHSIVSTSNRDITLAPNGTGEVTLSNNILATAGTTSIRPAGTEIVTINNTGDVTVIGQGSNRAMMLLKAGSNTANSQLRFGDQAADSAGRIMYDHSSNFMRFDTNEAERVRILSDGSFLVGKTSSSTTTTGFETQSSGLTAIVRDSNPPLYVGRNSDDGDIVVLRQGSTTVGSIGVVNNNNPFISNDADNSGLQFASTSILPHYDNLQRDNAVDLGSSSVRFKDGYFSGQVLAQFFTGVGDTDTYLDISSNPANTIKFYTGGAERGRFVTTGFVVGKTSSGDVSAAGAEMSTQGYGMFSHSTNIALYANRGDTGTLVWFGRAGANKGDISISSTAVAFNTSSDRRLKSNIQNAASASDKIDAIQVRQFDWKADDSHQDYGLIAQELQPIEPLAVTGDADSDKMMAVDYSKLVPMLIKEIQQLRGRVAALEAS